MTLQAVDMKGKVSTCQYQESAPPPSDTAPPVCSVSEENSGPPAWVKIAVSDAGSGLESIVVMAITWDGVFTTFRYDVNKNGGMFAYSPSQYLTFSQDTELFYCDPSQGRYDPCTSIASGDLVEFGGPPFPARSG